MGILALYVHVYYCQFWYVCRLYVREEQSEPEQALVLKQTKTDLPACRLPYSSLPTNKNPFQGFLLDDIPDRWFQRFIIVVVVSTSTGGCHFAFCGLIHTRCTGHIRLILTTPTCPRLDFFCIY